MRIGNWWLAMTCDDAPFLNDPEEHATNKQRHGECFDGGLQEFRVFGFGRGEDG